MVVRARLAPPPVVEAEWPELEAKWVAVRASLMMKGERRMEAENYLAGGHVIRQIIESRPGGWIRLGDVARCWQPSRLKGIQVSEDFGTPFLAATQVFDIRPVPRKWLSLARTDSAGDRFVESGTILVTCSGSVGRATLSHSPHDGTLISHDLLRVVPARPEWRGWVYAFLKSAAVREMMSASQYGHIIKHLETTHLDALPIPTISEEQARQFNASTEEILTLRDAAHGLSLHAEAMFSESLGLPKPGDDGQHGFAVSASESLFAQRRRFEAFVNRPEIRSLKRHLKQSGIGVTTVADSGYAVWMPDRFKRTPAREGVELLDSAHLFETNPLLTKRIADGDFGDPFQGRVKSGWLLLARSGQIYGINGSVMMATQAHEGPVVSDDIIRIAPGSASDISTGFIFVALSHPILGQPLVKALAYGSSIPHIDVSDVMTLGLVRLEPKVEAEIGDIAENAASLRGRADLVENRIAAEADAIARQLLRGGVGEGSPILYSHNDSGQREKLVAENPRKAFAANSKN